MTNTHTGELEEIEEWLEDLSEEDFRHFQSNFLGMLGLEELPPPPQLPDGFSLEKLSELLYSPWDVPGSPMFVRDDLLLSDLGQGMFFQNARIFLRELKKEGRFGLTLAGNLKRVHVNVLLEKCVWPPGHPEKVKEYNKVLNEEDVWYLHVLRILLDLTGLIRKQKGNYCLVKKRAALLRDEQAGELYQKLLVTYFRRMNMAFMSNQQPVPFLQESMPFILYRMQLMNEGWYPITEVMDNVLLEYAAKELLSQFGYLLEPEWLFYAYVLHPLELFGLADTRQTKTNEPEFIHTYSPDQVRKTQLFDKLFEFSEPFRLKY